MAHSLALVLVLVLFSVLSYVWCLFDSKNVDVVDARRFNALKKSNEPFLVKFFSSGCGHCINFAPEYERAAKALKGIFKVVAVEDRGVMGAENIQGFPTVKLYGDGSEQSYQGQRTANDVVNFVFKEMRKIVDRRLSGKGDKAKPSGSSGGSSEGSKGDTDVVVLTDNNFEKTVATEGADHVWFVMFYAPWCGHCTALKPTWDKLATALLGKVKVAKVDVTTNEMLGKHFEVKSFPDLRLIPPFGDRAWLQLPSRAVNYEGARKLEDLKEFAMQYAGAAATVEELLSQEQLDEKCAKGVCIVAILPHILDSKAAGRNDAIAILNEVLRATFSMPVTYLWIEGGAQFELEESLHLAFGYPAVVALNFDKKMYSVHKGTFTAESLRTFITGMMSGRASVDKLPEKLPKLKKVTAWDGKDAVQEDDEL